ncbi:family 20 glycosylhydrolase [Mycoplasmopsis cynos]|uniref:family 20 glycosylhydrolase n=1 Tax=Mycoplasmopsis cynos TaxID=171284 RepID=UPI002AFF82CE|nr:family 20 glycosylhydrolase [Mycoplasmopsis cynos]WQQ18540.1 family 20 glycosylhydrolase [Mycoplasmopsis cynos]
MDGKKNTQWVSNRFEDAPIGGKTQSGQSPAKDGKGSWLLIDLGKKQKVGSFQIFLDRDNISEYEIYASDTKENIDKQENKVYSWKKSDNDLEQLVLFGNFKQVKENVQFVKFKALKWQKQGRTQVFKNEFEKRRLKNSIYVNEFELYADAMNLEKNPYKILQKYENWNPEYDSTKKQIKLPDGIDLKTTKIKADYEQIVDENGKVTQPLTDKDVEILLVHTDENGRRYPLKPKKPKITIPGLHKQQDKKNQKPKVAVEIAEWWSDSSEKLKIKDNLKVFVKGNLSPEIKKILDEFKKDYKALFNKELSYQSFDKDAELKNNVIFDLSNKNINGFDNETYKMSIEDNVIITATHKTGANWATRTFLQMLLLDKDFSIPKGIMKDYPKYKVRGFSIDVGRKPISMQLLKDIVKQMSWYKLNELQVHLSDNLIQLDDYSSEKNTEKDIENSFNAYSGWRLESSKYKEINGKKHYLHNEDYHYTKKEFKEFMNYAHEYGVNIVPELDFPAHALSITKIWKEFAIKQFNDKSQYGSLHKPLTDHIDIKKEGAKKLIKEILDDYTKDGAIFDKASGTTVHMGADEFYVDHDAYYDFVNEMFKYFIDKGIQVRLWGSFSAFRSKTRFIKPEYRDKVQMSIWNIGFSHPQDMYNDGYNIINVIDSPGYIVPDGEGQKGPYKDFLDNSKVYQEYEANTYLWLNGKVEHKVELPSGSDQVLGGMFALWGDKLLDTRATGLNEYDLYERFKDAAPYYATKLWGIGSDGLDSDFEDYKNNIVNKLGQAPGINPEHKISLNKNQRQYFKYDFKGKTKEEKLLDKTGDFGILNLSNNVELVDDEGINALKINDKTSKVNLNLGLIGFDNKISFKIKRSKPKTDQEEEVIFSADAPYGQIAIKAKQKGSKNFGFSRELMDYTFNYELPYDKWVNIELVSEFDKDKKLAKTKLFVDGKETGGEAIGTNGSMKYNYNTNKPEIHTFKNSSLFLPLDYIGDGKNTFSGLITDIEHVSKFKDDKNKTKYEALDKIQPKLTTVKVNKVEINDINISNIDEAKYDYQAKILHKYSDFIVVNITISDKTNKDIFISKNFALTLHSAELAQTKQTIEAIKGLSEYNELLKSLNKEETTLEQLNSINLRANEILKNQKQKTFNLLNQLKNDNNLKPELKNKLDQAKSYNELLELNKEISKALEQQNLKSIEKPKEPQKPKTPDKPIDKPKTQNKKTKEISKKSISGIIIGIIVSIITLLLIISGIYFIKTKKNKNKN